MQPIQDLLNRIRWDREFGRGNFTVGYYDRLEGRVIVVPFRSLRFSPDDHFCFEITDGEGTVHSIPLHRVCAVYRDGQRIWHRQRCRPPG